MAPKQATPDVGMLDVEEMAEQGVTQFADRNVDAEFPDYAETELDSEEEIETPEPSAKTPEPTSRRSRAVARGEAEPAKTTADNLDDDPRFREWKSKMDLRLAQETQQRQAAERVLQEQQAQMAQAQLAAISGQLDDVDDPTERQNLIEQMAALRAQNYMTEWQRWQQHVTERVAAEGLDASDFNPMAYQGPTGAMQFELDVKDKKAAKLAKELETAKKAAAPETIAEIIQREVAKALQAQGLNKVDTGPGKQAPVASGDEWERDMRLLRQGKLPPGYMSKKYGQSS